MRRKSIASIIICLLVMCSFIGNHAKADEKVITISAANSAQTTDVVLVIDNSGSMKQTDPVKKDTNESVGTLATKMFINSTPLNGSKIGIVSFSAQLSDKKFWSEDLFNVDDMDSRNKLIGYVDAIKSDGRSGGTNIPVGVAQAENMLSQSNAPNKAIILITDGENDPQRDSTDPWANDPILKDLKDKNDVPIYAVGLNAGVPENKKGEFRDYLDKIAQSTDNERVFTIDSIDSITQVIQEIDAMVYKADKIVEFPVGQISIEMPENIKTCAMSFVSISNKNIDLQNVLNTKGEDVTGNKDAVYKSSAGSIANLTLNNPDKGLWKVTVKGDEGDRVRVEWKTTPITPPVPDIIIDISDPKKEKNIEPQAGENTVKLKMPENVKSCALSFSVEGSNNMTIGQVSNAKQQDVTDNKDIVNCKNSGTSADLTLTNPESGLWSVRINSDRGDKVKVEWDVTYTAAMPWLPIIIGAVLLIAAIVAFILFHDKKLPQLPGYMKVLLRQPDGSSTLIQDWLELGGLKNTVKKPVTLGKISGMADLNKVRIGQGDYNYEVTLNGQLPPYVTGLQGGLNTDDSCTLMYEDGKQVEFTYKSFLC